MAITGWNDPVSGNWNVATNWTDGAVPLAGDAAIISVPGGPYTVTVSSADVANSLAVNAGQATLRENSGSLTIAGGLHVISGLVSLNKANTIGSVALSGGVIEFGNGGALGTGAVTQTGGELFATASETLTNPFSWSGNSTIAAAHGTTLTLKGAGDTIAAGSTLNIGEPGGNDGTIIWDATFNSIDAPLPAINVEGGTLKGANAQFGSFLAGSPIVVAAGATLDLGGDSSSFTNLTGAGVVTNSGAAVTLFLQAANFSDAISGALSLEAGGAVFLSGNNTYTGTTTIDPGVNFEVGAGGTTGSIGGGAIIDKGTFFIFRSNAITLTNAISGSGVLWQTGSGVTSINTVNTYTGGTKLSAGTLAIGNGHALGTGALSQSGGELLATANETLTNALSISGATFAAAHGKTLTEKATNFSLFGGSTLNFGATGQDGTVVWDPSSSGITSPPPAINVAAGTLKGAGLSFLLGGSRVSVAAGATLDLGGGDDAFEFASLTGGGSVIDSGAAVTLTLGLANFSGVISGPLSLVADGTVILSGKNTYTGTTTIESGAIFQLGGGGTIGGGAIIDGGTFAIDNDSAVTLVNAVSGSGKLQQFGDGVTSINRVNTYTGGTMLSNGTLAIGNARALGAGTLTQSGGELLATANETLTNALSLSGTSTIAAAHGKALTVDESSLTIDTNSTLNIGSVGEDGTVLWHTSANGSSIALPFLGVHVQAGTLKAGDGELSFLLNNAEQTTIDAGARFDLAGFDTDIVDLVGAGAIIDSGAAATLTLDAASFSGTISGALKLDFNGDATLSGLEDTTGGATIEGAFTLTNAGTYDLLGNTNITGAAGSSFVNNKIFEKTGGGGVSLVTSNFVNNGALNVLSGSVQFTGGFTNHGVIHGRVTESGGVTTVSALVPSDFNEDGMSDIQWQNTTGGQAAIWEMNGSDHSGGGPVSPNPGPSWTEVGSGDFNGDGHADILWQNTTGGQAAVWEMNGNTHTGGGPVSSNPGPAWKAIGTGDFNGDGLSDILWQNASTGQTSIWEMNGASVIGGGAVSPNPGLAWKAIGTGDFNGDGHADILFQNTTSGQVSIWEMNGNSLIGGGPVSPNPGPNWRAVGTGDFNDDGRSDIVFQNATSGQVSIWEMNGNSLIGGGPVSPNPGPNWRAIGTGDFNGDGHSDILFQNTSGQASIWEMNGNTLTGGGPVSPNPGPNWRPVA